MRYPSAPLTASFVAKLAKSFGTLPGRESPHPAAVAADLPGGEVADLRVVRSETRQEFRHSAVVGRSPNLVFSYELARGAKTW